MHTAWVRVRVPFSHVGTYACGAALTREQPRVSELSKVATPSLYGATCFADFTTGLREGR